VATFPLISEKRETVLEMNACPYFLFAALALFILLKKGMRLNRIWCYFLSGFDGLFSQLVRGYGIPCKHKHDYALQCPLDSQVFWSFVLYVLELSYLSQIVLFIQSLDRSKTMCFRPLCGS